MSSRDQRQAAESELRSVEVHSEHLDVAEAPGPQATQIWALYPVMSPTPRESAAGTDWLRLALDAARRGRRLLIAGALAGFTLGGSYLALADAVYVVRTVLHVELRRSVVRDSDSRPGSGFIATQAEVFQSPALVTEAIRAIGLPEPKPPGLLASLKLRVASLLPFASQDPPGNPLDAAVLATLPMLQASPVVGTDVLNMTLRTVDPERGVRFLDALVSSYQSYVRENEAVAHREGLDVQRKREA